MAKKISNKEIYGFKELIELLFSGIYIQRRSTFPKIVSITQMEHGALELQLAYIIFNIIKERDKNESISLSKIYESFFWKNMFDFKFSDIKKDIMHYIKNDYPEIYQELRNKLKEWILDSNVFPPIKEWIQRFFDNSLSDTEEYIIELSKSIVSQIEIEHNKKIFVNEYEDVFNLLQSKENKLIKLLGITDNLPKIARILYKLKFVDRWNNTRRLNNISVLQHTFLVFALTYILWVSKSQSNLSQLLSTALFHDFAEAFTGDIPSPTKTILPEFKTVIGEIEKKLVEEKFLYLLTPYKFKNSLKKYILSPFTGENAKLLKTADNFWTLIEAALEIFPIFKRKIDYLISQIDTTDMIYNQLVKDILLFSFHNQAWDKQNL